MNPNCPDCGHPYSGHTSEGCWHHDLGVICGCMVLPPQGTRTLSKTGWEGVYDKLFADIVRLSDQTNLLKQYVEKLQEQLRVQTARADRLDKENDERFTRETEYQNRIRALEQRLRDVASYAARDLP